MKKTLIILLIIFTLPLYGTTYYVSSSDGSDSDSGLTEGLAWATISKVNGFTFAAGYIVLFKSGDTWREMLSVPRSGTSGAYMSYGKYGTGNLPRILGSVTSTWTTYSTNVWVSDATVSDPDSFNMYSRASGGGCEIFFENTNSTKSWGVHKTSIVNLTTEYDWYYTGGKIYVYAATDPDTRYTAVEIPQRNYIFNLAYRDYVSIANINMFYCGEVGITYSATGGGWVEHTGLTIDNCEIGYISVKNSEAAYGTEVIYNAMVVKNCEVHDVGRRALSFHHYGSYLVSNIIVEDNYFHDCYHTTGVDISVGNGSGMKIHNMTIRRNKFDDSNNTYSGSVHQIFVQNYDYGDLSSTICNLYIYSNIFISPVNAGINMEGAQSVYIYNNTFYGTGAAGWAQVWIDSNNDTIRIKNNIFYTSSTDDNNGCELFIRSSGRDLTYQSADYNAYYRVNNSVRVVENESVAMYYMNTLAALRSALGWENNGYFVDPIFTDAANGDFSLQSSSTVKAAGTDLDIALDYNGNAFDGTTPSIGAIQYGTITVVAPTVTTTTASSIAQITASSGGNVTDDGNGTVSARGVCWATTVNPTTSSSHTTDGTGTGTFTSSLTSLSASTLYYYRAYATNEAGTSYGTEYSFTTLNTNSGTYVFSSGGSPIILSTGNVLVLP